MTPAHNYKSFSLIYALVGFLIATVLWTIMFSPVTTSGINFWLIMSLAALCLTLYSLIIRREELAHVFDVRATDIILGIVSAGLLYGIFFTGNIVAQFIFPFAGGEIGGVYATRSQANTLLIGALLLFLIGPAEEIFWRGFAQEQLMQKMGRWQGFGATTLIYTLIHIPSLNFMLIMAALFAGLFWGFMYLKLRRLTPCIISHAIWDCVIFALLPITP